MHFHIVRATKTKTEIRQAQITRSALALVSREGLKRLSISAVARAVGVVPSALYRHFSGKSAVLDAVVNLIAQRLGDNVRAVRAETPDALERLRRLAMRHVTLVREEAPIPRVVFSEEIFHGPRQRRQRVYHLFGGYLRDIAGLIEEGQSVGRIRPELSAATLAMMFLGLVQPAAILWLMSDGAFDPARQVEEAWQVFAAMIEAKPECRPVTVNNRSVLTVSIQIKGVREPATPQDGTRFLVDRLWPRGVKKSALRLAAWLKEVAPSDALRQWFQHDPAKWTEFRRRYVAELDRHPEAWQAITAEAERGPVTLLFGARDRERNNAVVLRDYLRSRTDFGKHKSK